MLIPNHTQWIRWGAPLTVEEPRQPEALGIRALATILRRIRSQAYDLVVLPAINPDHRYDESPCKLIVKTLLQAMARSQPAVISLNHLLGSSPHIIVDIGDNRGLCTTSLRLFPRHCGYFKRELDLDYALAPRLARRVRPLPLFVPNEAWLPEPQPKSIDVFFAGALCNPVRHAAVEAARSLANHGLRVEIPATPLPYSEFMTALARSWLVLSPEGYGWDCYRHYEACLASSVPVINRPNYRRHLYLQDGVHCFYYDPAWGSLAELLRSLLVNKNRLRHMAEAGRQHVLAHHTRASVARYMLDEIAGAQLAT
jgi:hypothetical protein